jgi:hypothetical protein
MGCSGPSSQRKNVLAGVLSAEVVCDRVGVPRLRAGIRFEPLVELIQQIRSRESAMESRSETTCRVTQVWRITRLLDSFTWQRCSEIWHILEEEGYI